MQLARRVLAGGRAADERQQIDRVGEIAFDREPARDVLEVRIEPAVLVDDEDDRALALGLGAREVAVDLALGRVVGEALGRQPRVVGRDDRGLRVVVLQQRQQRGGGRGRAGELGQAVEEFAAVHAAMGEAVVEIDDFLVQGFPPCLSRSRDYNTTDASAIPLHAARAGRTLPASARRFGRAMWWQQRLGEFVTLFLVINPFGVLPVFLSIAGTLDPPAQRKLALDAVLISFVVLVFFVFAGAFLLQQMGISIRAFQISGGILLFLVALEMIRGESYTDAAGRQAGPHRARGLSARHPQDRRTRRHAHGGAAHRRRSLQSGRAIEHRRRPRRRAVDHVPRPAGGRGRSRG